MPLPIADPQERNRYVMSSLFQEALTSSQLEGAATTRADAKKMIRTGRKPRTRGERMVFNNYRLRNCYVTSTPSITANKH